MEKFNATPQKREELLSLVTKELEDYYQKTKDLKVASSWDTSEIRAFSRKFKLEEGNQAEEVLHHIIQGLSQFAVHTPHPSYFGLFNPRSNFTAILGDLITATFNPQLAAWSHSPFANEIENYLIQEFGRKFGYDSQDIDGTFCTGGAESNLTAVLCALNERYIKLKKVGLIGINARPVIYCSHESHHSIIRAAQIVGLGRESVRIIGVNHNGQMDTVDLSHQIGEDCKASHTPLMIVGTAGTTGAGYIDDIEALHMIAKKEGIWLHIDAAYGGGAIVSQKYRNHLKGIHLSDSITLDLHKWFSVPMGASLFITRIKKILGRTFGVKTAYMPKEEKDVTEMINPYAHSIQWSRRFIGLKVYLPIAIHGWEGYEAKINHQIEMGGLLRNLLREKGWIIKNKTQLPIVCFTHPNLQSDENRVVKLVDKIIDSGKAWLSTYPIGGENTLRACITTYSTTEKEIVELMELLAHHLRLST